MLEVQAVCVHHLALFSFGNTVGYERVYKCRATRP